MPKTEGELLMEASLWREVARNAYAKYRASRVHTLVGSPMRTWEDIDEVWQDAWIAGVKEAVEVHHALFVEPAQRH